MPGNQSQPAGALRSAAGAPPVVFFDGVCGLCNRFVDFLMANDAGRVLRYAPLQGETAAARLSAEDRNRLATLVYVDEAGLHRRSDAVVRILHRIGGIWRPVSWLLRAIPSPVREAGYRFVAGTRYRIFGKRETCRLPTPEERGRLLP